MGKKRGTKLENEYVRRLRLARELAAILAKMDGCPDHVVPSFYWGRAYDRLKANDWLEPDGQ